MLTIWHDNFVHYYILTWWRGLPTMDGKTARGASSPAKPALHIPEPLSTTKAATSSSHILAVWVLNLENNNEKEIVNLRLYGTWRIRNKTFSRVYNNTNKGRIVPIVLFWRRRTKINKLTSWTHAYTLKLRYTTKILYYFENVYMFVLLDFSKKKKRNVRIRLIYEKLL